MDAPDAYFASAPVHTSQQKRFLQVFLNQFGCRAQHLRLIAEARDPMHLRLAPEPGQLPLGVVAMALLGGLYRFFDRPRLPQHASACR